ncbi:hypothetical protein GYMLUDRAFT_493558 [Collybiopsis luxurians FD-317 M1]|uniref:Unplaced genomic scaffold GYMLUscaffold_181, whole genome shotgun sequence n=1 Tax=Collybiopsis luxurians FD-317 M1 TaxID=944289 RepID=A0A0D0BL03_9AGAR|nr:hypothetical protein GYMLUDRAFT_493558 [Collybiopsis luxurians FD-317 M1]
MSEWESYRLSDLRNNRTILTYPNLHILHELIFVVPELQTCSERKCRLKISGSTARLAEYRSFETAGRVVYVVQHFCPRRARYMIPTTLHRRPG